MFLGVSLKEGSRFQLLFKNLLENKPKNNMYFSLKPLKLDSIPTIRYEMILSHHVPNAKQDIRLY